MRALQTMLLSGLMLSAMSQAHAATLVPVTPPAGAVATIVFGINEHNVIAGSFFDSGGVEHGFFGPLNGTYTTFDVGGTTIGTEPRGISDMGVITGFAPDPSFAIGTEFLREGDGTLLTLAKNGIPLDGIAQGVNKKADSTGDYIDPNTGVRTGYLAHDGVYGSDVDLSLGAVQTSPRGISKQGTLAGFFFDSGAARHGFILDRGVVQVIDADASGTTALEGINIHGFATGQVVDASGNPHAFTYDSSTGTFTTIDVPDGSVLQQAWGVNDHGLVALSTDVATYIYCPQKQHCPKGGTDIADGRSWQVKPGSTYFYDRNGRTGARPSRVVNPVRGARQ